MRVGSQEGGCLLPGIVDVREVDVRESSRSVLPGRAIRFVGEGDLQRPSVSTIGRVPAAPGLEGDRVALALAWSMVAATTSTGRRRRRRRGRRRRRRGGWR
jgi:hypothetical protein